jgi:hypothetical protein
MNDLKFTFTVTDVGNVTRGSFTPTWDEIVAQVDDEVWLPAPTNPEDVGKFITTATHYNVDLKFNGEPLQKGHKHDSR